MIQYLLFETRIGDWLCALIERVTGQALVVSEDGRGLTLAPLREVEGA
jgi:hypothetical protein